MNQTFRTLLVAAVAATVLTAGPALAQGNGPQNPRQGPAAAQGQHGRGGQGAGPLARMAQELGLSDAQKQQMKPILASFRQESKSRMEAHRAQFQAILTPEQQARLEQMKAERGQGKGERGQGNVAQGQGKHEGPFKELNLTEDQKTRLQALRQQQRTEGQAAFQRLVAQINPILTPEQQAKLQQMIQERKQGHGKRGGGPQGQTR